MNTSKTDFEIYTLAGEVFSRLTNELEEAHYKQKSGSLTVSWSDEKAFNAWACSGAVRGGAPIHKIVLNYELVRQIYRDAEDFCAFTQDERFIDLLPKFPPGSLPFPLLPEMFNAEECINNMFFSGLTWIYFHELGHLVQEHGFVRGEKAQDSNTVSISELESNAAKPLTGREAVISHVTELAADHEATVICLKELLRHFTDEKLVGAGDNRQALVGASYLLICSLSCIFYRFNGGRVMPAEPVPTGTHPNAIFRLECAVPQIYEILDAIRKGVGHTTSRRDLVMLAKQAADLAAMFWYFVHSDKRIALSDLLIKGLGERPEFKKYAQEVITAWDEILPGICEVRHFGLELGILRFSDSYRHYVFGDTEGEA